MALIYDTGYHLAHTAALGAFCCEMGFLGALFLGLVDEFEID